MANERIRIPHVGALDGLRGVAVAGVVVFGSSFNVEHADEQPFIKEVRELTREAVDTGVPYLGVCFGAQMLAWSLDAEITKAPSVDAPNPTASSGGAQ